MPSEVIKFVIKESGLEDMLSLGSTDDQERLENMKELVTLATKYDIMPGTSGLEKLLEDASLASDQDTLIENRGTKSSKGGVKLMTVHASKGLEFEYVFITGLEQDLFPHERTNNNKKEDGEEERRLFYVALTRARKKLFLSYAQLRTIFGMKQVNTPSEFIHDIPEHLTAFEQGDIGRKEKIVYI
jgi:DNA helicase-2/ATP-dependent DNA helicase PcrA